MAVTIRNRLFENMHEVANTTYLSTAVIYDCKMCITFATGVYSRVAHQLDWIYNMSDATQCKVGKH
jgi:hypothetical protein